MKKLQVPQSLILVVSILLGLVTFFFDFLRFESSLSFVQWEFVHEFLTVLIIIGFYYYIKPKPWLNMSDLVLNLKFFIKLLTGLYLWVFAFKYLLSPSYTATNWPPLADSHAGLIYSNLISIGTIIFLIPMLMIIKNLIYFKQQSRTAIYIKINLVTSAVVIFLAVYYKLPLDFEFGGDGLYITIAAYISMLFFFLLSTNNSWITYLSKKEKYTYFLFSILLAWVISLLGDFAFKDSVAAHSIALATFAYLGWFFLFIYSVFASVTFLFHLPTARVFERKMREVSSLHRLGRVISAEFEPDKLVNIITEMTTHVIESSHTWIELYDEKHDNLVVSAVNNLKQSEFESFNNHIIQEIGLKVIESKEPININNVSKSATYAGIKKWKKEINSLAAAPLIDANGSVLGLLFATKSVEFGFDPDDIKMLEAYANQAAIAIENAKLVKNSLERERMERELQIARDVQMRLLPQSIPDAGSCSIDTLTITAYEVGGDYYDFFPTKENNVGIIIGDVSGKGTSAAFYMAETKGIIQSISRSNYAPYDILVNTNEILFESIEKKSFITLLAAQIDYKKHILRFSRAGHCPVIHFQAAENKIHFLQPSGIAVGLDKGPIFRKTLAEEKVKLEDNDILAFYTDGLSEAMNKQGEEFGDERIGDIIKTYSELPVEEIKEKLIDHILNFLDGKNLHDDLTLVLLKC